MQQKDLPLASQKDLLDVDQLTQEELSTCLILPQTTKSTPGQSKSPYPQREKSVVLFFAEPSTRTKTSFDMAGKRFPPTPSGWREIRAFQKGESMKDTALTLQAMNPDVIVIRHSSSGAAVPRRAPALRRGQRRGRLARASPQALLDAFSLRRV